MTAHYRPVGRMGATPPRVDSLFQDKGLAALVARSQLHAAILREIRKHLPIFLADHCLACVAHEDRVLIYTDSPAWATQLRFAVPAALPPLRQTFRSHWGRIQVRILKPEPAPPKERSISLPGQAAQEQIESAAASAPSGEIGEALARLAATWRSLVR